MYYKYNYELSTELPFFYCYVWLVLVKETLQPESSLNPGWFFPWINNASLWDCSSSLILSGSIPRFMFPIHYILENMGISIQQTLALNY